MSNRQALVAHARDSIARGSKSFAMASKLFDAETRERVWLLYAWCRACDDLADGQDHGHALSQVADPAATLRRIYDLTAKGFAGQPTGDAAFDALGVLAAETGVTLAMANQVIEGFALDAADWQPRTEADLLRYCWHVAGAVGVMMAMVMGVDPSDDDTLERAADLGMAFQLANIARDIAEDDAANRCYLPQEWLTEMDIPPGQTLHPRFRPRLTVLVRRLCRASESYQASARIGATRLPLRCRWAVLAATGIYGDIARKVEAAGDHAFDHRMTTSKREKLAWLVRSGWAAWHSEADHRSPRQGLDFTRHDLMAHAAAHPPGPPR